MSELRQRHGGASGGGPEGLPSVDGQNPLTPEAVQEWINSSKRQPKPGLSNEAKAAKDALERDPYNMELVLELGVAYMQDDQWDRCLNVMIRGMKRIHEFKELDKRLQFGSLLCHASMQNKKYQQALAVLQEMELPTDDEQLRAFSMLACKVYCQNKKVPDALKALKRVAEGQKGTMLCTSWACLASSFKQAGAYEAAKSCVEAQLTSEERKKLDAMETLMELKDVSVETPPSFIQSPLFKVVIVIMACMLIFILYKLESASLAKMSPNK